MPHFYVIQTQQPVLESLCGHGWQQAECIFPEACLQLPPGTHVVQITLEKRREPQSRVNKLQPNST
jgi:hypothetical protein